MLHFKAHFKRLVPLAVMAAVVGIFPPVMPAQVFVSVRIGPPALPVYTQPPCPTPGYLWTPGYWAYGPMGYYWVPGVWVSPPRVGFLWTPGYWGWANGLYAWHGGYWGPHVGFYGGVNYGFGYGGFGFAGGSWVGSEFRYNMAVAHSYPGHESFNGPGGVMAQPRPEERAWEHEQHFQPTGHQLAHLQTASQDRNQFASFNHGRPGVTAMDSVGGRRFTPEARVANQQERIGQGIQRGQISPGQGANLERREQHINQQIHQDQRANGGHLTQQEHRQVNREQNHASQKIHEDRHPHEGGR
jgi:hypothetical protein